MSNGNVVVLAERGEPKDSQRLPEKRDATGIACEVQGLYIIEAYDARTLIVGYWVVKKDERVYHYLTPFSYRRGKEMLYSRAKTVRAGGKPLYLSHRRICGKGYIGVTEREEALYSDDEIDLIIEMEQIVQGAIAQGIARAERAGLAA